MSYVGRDALSDTLPGEAPGGCLSDDEVLAFASGDPGDAQQRARIDRHLDRCPECFELVFNVAQLSESSPPDVLAPRGSIATTFVPGQLVSDRYLVQRFVARGGMGEVYEARDRKLRERVALKTVVCTAADSPSAVRKLFDEVQLARRIQHRNVCRIHELHEHVGKGQQPSVQFLSMEFIEGERLGDYVRRRGPLPVDEALGLARQLLAGLQAAHEAQVLHLDFKTDNVMLRPVPEGAEAVIMDFGLSRAFETEARLRTSEQRQLVGSLAYMSPEQVECRERLGPEADIYAFGIVLFELLTGHLPFAGDSPVAVMLRRLKERPPAPSRSVPEVPPALDAFVLKCLSRDRRARYRDIAQALIGLQAASAQRGAARWVRRTGLAALALLTLLAGALWYARPRELARAPQALSAAPAALLPAPPPVPPVAEASAPELPPAPAPAAESPSPTPRPQPRAAERARPHPGQPPAAQRSPASGNSAPDGMVEGKSPAPAVPVSETGDTPSRRLPGAPTRLSW